MKKLAILVLACAAACGDDGPGNLTDAPVIPDAPDGPPAPVTLTVTVDGMPSAGVTVHFQNADSSLVKTVTTDAAGVASAVMDPGGFVTAIEPDPPIQPDLAVPGGVALVDNTLTSWAGVQPGDNLRLDLFGRGGGGTLITFDVIIPNDPNASSYQLFTSCGSADITPPLPALTGGVMGLIAVPNPPVSVTLFDCAQGLADMAVLTLDGKLQPLSSFYLPNIPVAENQTVMLDGTYAAAPSTSVTVSNVPAELPNLGFDHTLVSPRGFLFNTFQQFAPASGTASGGLPVIASTGATGVMAVIGFAQSGAFSEQTVVDWGPYSATFALDWGASAIKDYTSEPSFDPATKKISWTLGATGGNGDVTIGQYGTFRSGGNPEHAWTWRIVGPAGAEITYPTLPPGQPFDFNTVPTDSFGVDRVTTAKVPGGYAAVRALAHNDEPIVAGPSGRAAVVDMFFQPERRAPRMPRDARRFVQDRR